MMNVLHSTKYIICSVSRVRRRRRCTVVVGGVATGRATPAGVSWFVSMVSIV